MLRNVLVPLDGSRLSEAVLPVLGELAGGTKAKITLFSVGEAPEATSRRRKSIMRPVPLTGGQLQQLIATVLEPRTPGYAETRDQAVARAEQELLEYLDKVGRPLLKAGLAVEVAVHFGDPAREIVALAKRGKFDLIAMATHGRSGLRQVVQGSVAAAVLRSGVAPMLLVRPKQRAGSKS